MAPARGRPAGLRRAATRAAVAAGVSLLAFLALPPSAASAHAVFVSASPAPDAKLRTPPRSVRMVFSEPLDAALSGIDVYRSSGRAVPTGTGRVDPGNPRAYGIVLPRLRPDRYAVVWHTVSAIDGHSRRGSYSFTLDRPDGSAPRIQHGSAFGTGLPPQVPTSGQAAATWAGLAGLFLMTGSVLVGLLGTGTGVLEAGMSRRWLWRLLLAGAGGLLAGTVGQLISAWAPTGWGFGPLGALLSSSAGRWWEIRVVAGAVAVAAWRTRPRSAAPRRGPRGFLQAIGVGIAAYSFAATSHGAAAAVGAGAGVAYEFVHVLASSVWLGGAVAVAVVWAASRRATRGGRRALLRRYSVVAGVAVPAVLASGLGNAVLELGKIGDLVTSSYGLSLLLKLVVVLALLALAAVNAVLFRPALDAGRPGGRRLDRTIAVEAVLGLAVLVPTAVLAVLAPSRPGDQARAAASTLQAQADPARAFIGSTQLGGRDAEVTVTPGAAGANAVRVEVSGVEAATRLQLAVAGPGASRTVDLARTGYDHDSGTNTIYAGSLQLGRAGTWQAVLRPAGGTGAGVPITMPVSARPARASAPAGTAGLAAWLVLIALAGVAACLFAAARAVPAGRARWGTRALGASGLVAAVAWACTLGFGNAVPAAPAATWGQARTVRPAALAAARVWRLPTRGAGLMMPAVAPDGSVWVAEMNANKVARLDPRTGVVQEFRFPGAYRETMGVAVAADGRVWLAQEHAMALGMFDPAAGRYRQFPIPGADSAPLGIAVGANGDVWFTEMSGNRIGRFDPSTARFAEYPIPTPDAAPYWLALGPHGTVWFTEFGSGKVGKLDPRTGRVREYTVPGRPNVPGIAVAGDGTVWLTTIQGSLFGLTPSSGRVRRIALPAAGDYGVAVGPGGTVWVGRNGGRTMYAVQPVTGRLSRYRLPPGSAPWWPVVDPRGRVWVALAGDRGNGLARLSPAP